MGSPGAPGVLSRRALTWAAVGGGLAVVTAWVLLQPAPLALGGDNETLHHPLFVDVLRQLGEGRLPVWTTGRWGGSPLAGDPVLGATYPANYLGYLVAPIARALDVAACVHLAVFVFGFFWCCGRLGVRPWVALVATVLAATNPAFVYVARSWINWWGAIAWWPWLLGATFDVGRDGRRAALAAVALAGQVYAGYPQFALHSGLLAVAVLLLASTRPWRARLADVALVVLGGIGLAAPQLLPGLAMADESVRLGPGGAERLAALDVVAIAPAAWPDVFSGKASLTVVPCKLALAVVVLAVIGTTDRRRGTWLFAIGALVAAAFASGPAWLMRPLHALPLFGFFAGPVKFFYVAAFLVHVLAARGLDRVCAASARTARVVAAVALGASAAFLVQTAALSTPQPFSRDPFTPLLKTSPVDERATPADRWIALDEGGGTLRQTGMNFGALWGIASVSGVGPLPPWREFEVLGNAEAGTARAMIEQVGASRVVVRAGTPLETSLVGAGLGPMKTFAGLSVLAAPPMPVAFLAPHVRYVDAATAIAAARRGEALRPDGVLIEATPASAAEEGDGAGHVEPLGSGVGSYRLRVNVARPTWLVVREPYYRSWRATIDGAAAEIRPAGGFFLAARVAPGSHEVSLAYREPRLLPGVAVLVLAAITLAVAGRRRATA